MPPPGSDSATEKKPAPDADAPAKSPTEDGAPGPGPGPADGVAADATANNGGKAPEGLSDAEAKKVASSPNASPEVKDDVSKKGEAKKTEPAEKGDAGSKGEDPNVAGSGGDKCEGSGDEPKAAGGLGSHDIDFIAGEYAFHESWGRVEAKEKAIAQQPSTGVKEQLLDKAFKRGMGTGTVFGSLGAAVGFTLKWIGKKGGGRVIPFVGVVLSGADLVSTIVNWDGDARARWNDKSLPQIDRDIAKYKWLAQLFSAIGAGVGILAGIASILALCTSWTGIGGVGFGAIAVGLGIVSTVISGLSAIFSGLQASLIREKLLNTDMNTEDVLKAVAEYESAVSNATAGAIGVGVGAVDARGDLKTIKGANNAAAKSVPDAPPGGGGAKGPGATDGPPGSANPKGTVKPKGGGSAPTPDTPDSPAPKSGSPEADGPAPKPAPDAPAPKADETPAAPPPKKKPGVPSPPKAPKPKPSWDLPPGLSNSEQARAKYLLTNRQRIKSDLAKIEGNPHPASQANAEKFRYQLHLIDGELKGMGVNPGQTPTYTTPKPKESPPPSPQPESKKDPAPPAPEPDNPPPAPKSEDKPKVEEPEPPAPKEQDAPPSTPSPDDGAPPGPQRPDSAKTKRKWWDRKEDREVRHKGTPDSVPLGGNEYGDAGKWMLDRLAGIAPAEPATYQPALAQFNADEAAKESPGVTREVGLIAMPPPPFQLPVTTNRLGKIGQLMKQQEIYQGQLDNEKKFCADIEQIEKGKYKEILAMQKKHEKSLETARSDMATKEAAANSRAELVNSMKADDAKNESAADKVISSPAVTGAIAAAGSTAVRGLMSAGGAVAGTINKIGEALGADGPVVDPKYINAAKRLASEGPKAGKKKSELSGAKGDVGAGSKNAAGRSEKGKAAVDATKGKVDSHGQNVGKLGQENAKTKGEVDGAKGEGKAAKSETEAKIDQLRADRKREEDAYNSEMTALGVWAANHYSIRQQNRALANAVNEEGTCEELDPQLKADLDSVEALIDDTLKLVDTSKNGLIQFAAGRKAAGEAHNLMPYPAAMGAAASKVIGQYDVLCAPHKKTLTSMQAALYNVVPSALPGVITAATRSCNAIRAAVIMAHRDSEALLERIYMLLPDELRKCFKPGSEPADHPLAPPEAG